MNDRMAGGMMTTLRNIAQPKGYTRRRPFVYPIFLVYSPREAEGLRAELSLISHTLEDLRVLRGSHPGIISVLSPGTLRLSTAVAT